MTDDYFKKYGDIKERELYFMREKSLKDEISALANAEKKGMQRAKIESARNLLDILDDETIAVKLGLDLDTVKRLRDENM